MKRISIIAAFLMLSIASFAQNGKSIYQKYSDAKDVSAVYISPAMFRIIGRLPDLETGSGNVNLSAVVRSLSGLYIISSENPAINKSLSADAMNFVNEGKYELLMEAKEDGECVRMYTVGTEKIINGFVMIASEDKEVTYIYLDGRMDREEFENLLKSGMDR